MVELLLAPENLVFSTALVLMLLIGAAELAGLLIGQSLSDGIDALLPEMEFNPHAEVGNVEGGTALSRLLGWLRIGQVPLLMLLVVFLLSFGVLGLLLQGILAAIAGSYLPGWLAAIPVVFVSLPCVRSLGGILERYMPRDETTAVSADSLIGRMAQITLGTARADMPAEAKVKDQHGYTHYLRVIPEEGCVDLPQGSRVLLTSRSEDVYTAIANPSPTLNEP